MAHSDCHIAVIGGGIVGMASAMALLEGSQPASRALGAGFPALDDLPLIVLEAEPRLAQHQTGRNSGVIHSGLYYKAGSLKAALCAGGREAMFDFCARRGIPHERCGKVVVATSERELPALAELERRGLANGLAGVRRLTPEAIREHEPHVRALAGLHVPQTGIVSYAAVLDEMAHVVRERGGVVRTGARLVDVERRGGSFVLHTSTGSLRARNVVNCAGLQSDRVAHLFGADPGVRIIPFRGEYYDLLPHARALVRNLIYPVPDPRFPFLGVHFTRGVDGAVEAGPNAVLALAREGYDWSTASPADLAQTLAYPGFWRMAARHWRMGLMEARRSLQRDLFVEALQVLIPRIRDSDVVPGRAGVRAQALDRTGTLLNDFHVVREPGLVHVLNAPSPAATASIAIGNHIAGLAWPCFRGEGVAE